MVSNIFKKTGGERQPREKRTYTSKKRERLKKRERAHCCPSAQASSTCNKSNWTRPNNKLSCRVQLCLPRARLYHDHANHNILGCTLASQLNSTGLVALSPSLLDNLWQELLTNFAKKINVTFLKKPNLRMLK